MANNNNQKNDIISAIDDLFGPDLSGNTQAEIDVLPEKYSSRDLISGRVVDPAEIEEENKMREMALIEETWNEVEVAPSVDEYEIDKRTDDFYIPERLHKMPDGAAGSILPLIRSNLFGVVRRGRPPEVTVQISSEPGRDIKYKGERLNVNDEAIWMCCVRMCKREAFGSFIRVTIQDFLRELEWADNGDNRKKVKNGLMRLRGGKLDFQWFTPDNKKKLDVYSTFLEFTVEDDKYYSIRLALGSKAMFSYLTYVSWDMHKKLLSGPEKRRTILSQLHLYVSTNVVKSTYPVYIDSLQEWFDLNDWSKKKFREKLWLALSYFAEKGWISDILIDRHVLGYRVSWKRQSQFFPTDDKTVAELDKLDI